jgi:hypothetical protein
MRNDDGNSQGSGGKRGHAMLAAGVIFGGVLALLFVIPGFVAAGFTRSGVVISVVDGDNWCVEETIPGDKGNIAGEKMAQIVLCPAFLLMSHSPAACKFYAWEFRVAGGHASVLYD